MSQRVDLKKKTLVVIEKYVEDVKQEEKSAPDASPFQPISGACSIEKYPSSRMANRYTRIFDAG